jgi:hypothetical protein
MYNLSDEIFMETIIYLQNFGLDYFEFIRTNLDKFDETLLLVRHGNLEIGVVFMLIVSSSG